MLAFSALACSEEAKPKPKGELRLEYPQPHYQAFTNPCAYTFEYSDFAAIADAKQACWYNLRYPKMKANVFITYFPVKNDFDAHVKKWKKWFMDIPLKLQLSKPSLFLIQRKSVWKCV